MIDTGSTISAISSSYFKKINNNELIFPSTTSCRTANNTQLNILGRVILPININGIVIEMTIFIVENLCTELLLGGDFCNAYNVNICYRQKCLLIKIKHQQMKIKFLPQVQKHPTFNVAATHDINIPPLSSRVIQASTSAPAMEAIFTPSFKVMNKQYVLAPHAIVTIGNDQLTTLTLLNTTTAIQTIRQGTNLGHVRCHQTENCYYVGTNEVKNQHHISSTTTNLVHHSTISSSSINNSLHNMISHLPTTQQEPMRLVVAKHQSIFDTTSPSIMKTNNVTHRIPIQPYHQPIQSYPYRKSMMETQLINDQVKDMLGNRIVRPSSSPWSSPVVIIKKKDGSPRFCVDYRRLNLITERDLYPLPRIDDIIDRLTGSQYFSTLDLKAGYWQVPIDEEDKKKTAFVTTDGLFEFNVLPFGLSNAPATFQRIINSVLGTLRWDISLVYLDDIIVYSSSFAKHVQHLDLVFDALAKANVKLNISKCTIARKQLDYLGFRITQHGVKPTTTNVKKTIDFPTPTSAKAAHSFIQMTQFYRKFIQDFASIAAPFNIFKNKNAKFEWTDACQRSFDILKQKLSQYPLLAFFDGKSKLKLKINTDASNAGIGGVLHQISPEGRLHPIQYLSRSLSKREQKYSVIEKECLAMVWCVTKLRPYLYGRQFTLVTDHHPLCWLNKQSSKNGRLDRWSLQLQEYTFDIKHTSGPSNCVADCLSRYPIEQPDDIVEEQLDLMHVPSKNIIMAMNATFDSTQIREAQASDPIVQRIRIQLTKGKQGYPFQVDNAMVHKIIHRSDGTTLTLPYIPSSLIHQLLKAYHDSPTSGHLGINKTWHKVRDRYFWPNMYKNIKEYVLKCPKCQQFKVSRKKPAGKLAPIAPPTGVLDLMGLDFIGPIPQSSKGHKYILVCTDYLSRYAITQATVNCTAETAAKFLVEQVILHYGVPKQLLTDRGSHFMANVFEAIASRCGVNHITTTTYHPQCNGLTERFNSTLAGSIGTYVNQQQSDWDEYLPYVTFAYNTSKQSTTQIEPFKLMYGREAILPFDVPQPITKLSTVNDYYTQLVQFLKQAKSSAWPNIKRQANIYKRTYDTGRQDLPPLKPGQLVLLKQMMVKNLRKFSPKYYGPFTVIKQLSRLNYEVKHVTDSHTETVHVSRIRLII